VKQGRVDLRELPLVTIDGADARDFDDAVFAQPEGKGWRLWVAIADVSAYVRPGSALDIEGQLRGNSVYFPEQVIPMLPEALSNGLCSLNPDVDRLCMVCEMHVSPDGKVDNSEFYPAVMRSHARLTYDLVAEALLNPRVADREGIAHLLDHLKDLRAVYHAFAKARRRRGAIDFESTETRIEFGKDRKIERIVPVQRNDAHKMIEECMIAANVQAGRFLARHKMPTLFRVHERPSEEKLEELRSFVAERGLTLGGGNEPQAEHYAQLLSQAADRPDARLIQTVMLRSLMQAVYTPANEGHFGLALECYAHFTSPIRRYPDLLVHRAIKHVLEGGEPENFEYSPVNMQQMGAHCSMTERRADDATRDAVNWLKCEYMMDRIGDEFTGLITTVTPFGLFVELDDIYVEGLVHVSSLRNDYYQHDPKRHCLRGERSGVEYHVADPIQVRLLRVDLDERKIDFEPIESSTKAGPAKTKQGKQNRARKGQKAKQAAAKRNPSKPKSSSSKSRSSKKRKANRRSQ
ncbi:MAG: ribonuclease R, partial [Salinisphaeraceae bacterium]|nr:ribonuclease R [Salinisphaeraceae bacterium]